MNVLLDRDRFRETALKRDGYRCVICDRREGLSVHHIIERNLFVDGGYYINNAATLCEQHHLEAEKTVLTVEAVRNAAKIIGAIVPPQLDASRRYDKWGNDVLPDGTRLKGPMFSDMFSDDGCQKALKAAGLLHLFSAAGYASIKI
jgi:hypothetical protein